jgi:hypothetical protein
MSYAERNYASEIKGDSIWNEINDDERLSIRSEGTRGTAYEAHGRDVCAQLEHRSRAWYVSRCARLSPGS